MTEHEIGDIVLHDRELWMVYRIEGEQVYVRPVERTASPNLGSLEQRVSDLELTTTGMIKALREYWGLDDESEG